MRKVFRFRLESTHIDTVIRLTDDVDETENSKYGGRHRPEQEARTRLGSLAQGRSGREELLGGHLAERSQRFGDLDARAKSNWVHIKKSFLLCSYIVSLLLMLLRTSRKSNSPEAPGEGLEPDSPELQLG